MAQKVERDGEGARGGGGDREGREAEDGAGGEDEGLLRRRSAQARTRSRRARCRAERAARPARPRAAVSRQLAGELAGGGQEDERRQRR